MNDYIELRIEISPCSEDTTDLLAAFLCDEGYESFQADSTGLTAYIRSEEFSEEKVEEILNDFPMEIESSVKWEVVKSEDWNEEWEKNYFQPIAIGKECVVRSTFHKDVPSARYEILIDPKMAFGTGHHATTSMMLRHILELPVEGKRVIDMGTGTGILAILAAKKGAASVSGIEIDPGACLNARDNVEINNVSLEILEGDAGRLDTLTEADIFLANINRNVILADLERYARKLAKDGVMVLSGFYEADLPLILRGAALYNLEIEKTLLDEDKTLTENDPALSHGKWASLRLRFKRNLKV